MSPATTSSSSIHRVASTSSSGVMKRTPLPSSCTMGSSIPACTIRTCLPRCSAGDTAAGSLRCGSGELTQPGWLAGAARSRARSSSLCSKPSQTTSRLRGNNGRKGTSTPNSNGSTPASIPSQSSPSQGPLGSSTSSLVHTQIGSQQSQAHVSSGAGKGPSVGLSSGNPVSQPPGPVGPPAMIRSPAGRSAAGAVGATPPGKISAPPGVGGGGGNGGSTGGVGGSPSQKGKNAKKGKGGASSTAISAASSVVTAPSKVVAPSVAPSKTCVVPDWPELPELEDEDDLDGFGGDEPDELDGYRGLVLDCSYRPINVVCWKRALCLEIAEKVDVLEYYDVSVRSASCSFLIPAVLRVSNFVHTPKQSKRKLSLSRNNIFLRDKFRCQYCGSKDNLTIDHVKALSRGGGSSWENLVTACSSCNLKKGDKSPVEAGMKLAYQPREPRELDCSKLPPNYKTFRSLTRQKSTPPQWLDWLPLQQPSIS